MLSRIRVLTSTAGAAGKGLLDMFRVCRNMYSAFTLQAGANLHSAPAPRVKPAEVLEVWLAVLPSL